MFRSFQYIILSWLLGLSIIFLPINAVSGPKPSGVKQTQLKLKKLGQKITRLQKNLNKSNNKQQLLYKEIETTDKQIGKLINQNRQLKNEITEIEKKIAPLEKKLSLLKKKQIKQQKLLASHLKARYQIGEYQPIKWLLNNTEFDDISRTMTYYQYLMNSRLKAINKIKKNEEEINQVTANLNEEAAGKKQLQNSLINKQKRLNQDKSYQKALINNLNKDIQSKQKRLQEYQKNKTSLTRLLNQLNKQTTHLVKYPFPRMRKRLPFPVKVNRKNIKTMNQGIALFAKEGAAVRAIYPGKVVFSDWLKGYGLLMIIDHGKGYMSLYAHNESLFKRKGDEVSQYEPIAQVGHSGGLKKNGLYFEIRYKGKTIPPLRWLS